MAVVENHRSFNLEMNEIFMLIGKHFGKISIQNDLSPAKCWFLMYLYRKEKATVNDLANETGITSGATSLAIKGLEKNGYVVRERDEDDRRVVWVCVTAQGKEAAEDFYSKRAQVWKKLMQPLSDTEREIFQLLLKKMAEFQTP